MNPTIAVRPALPGDVAAIAALLAEAITDDPVATWLVPDPSERQAVFHGRLAMEVDHAVEWGHVDVTLDLTAAAVWRHHPASNAALLAERHMNTFTGHALPRFRQLHHVIDRYRSDAPHHWLSLYVTPHSRGQGIGSDLLAHHHRRIDQLTNPVDTVVTTEAARDFLRSHGYRPGLPLHLPNGPRLWPLTHNGHPSSARRTTPHTAGQSDT
ncbi:GNAT family N-acetyltransferase [Micromonospora sp. HUAS LYJ1]|uniref:GNAT family N-acetyltransferase n=1 Tax=Micromonospora sp. HUAS LYJ1 TaxID=3061626 RepID=UPI002670D3A2|nr:GNAT family N-acetyltransferase [Micromonospora sp. HUAS LYJ1]WKU05494.1 GNAT family N-acetyltransferase [Micromonospora sp. HUAS LYJ1]